MNIGSFLRIKHTLLCRSSVIVLTVLTILSSTSICWGGEVRVAAASSLSFALEDIQTTFEDHTPHTLKISLAASGTLARQIAHGAPFDIFLSADAESLIFLKKSSTYSNASALYAYGDLVYFSPARISLIDSLQAKQRLSLANPNVAPYGRMAKAYLEKISPTQLSDQHLILGDNAAQAARFATSGAVTGALIPRSLAIKLAQRQTGFIFELVPSPSPLEHHMVRFTQNNSQQTSSQVFFDFMLSETAQNILARHGFRKASGNIQQPKTR